MIQFQGISKTFTSTSYSLNIIQNLTDTFQARTTYAVVGPSGSGKSTLLHMIAGLEKPTTGVVTLVLEGKEYSTDRVSSCDTYLKKHVGILFQHPYLIPELTTLENIALKGYILGEDITRARTRAQELLQWVNLSHKADKKPSYLSGGERQRIALARALYTNPSYLLADEPTAHLDAESAESILNLLESVHTTYGTGMIITTHDWSIARCMQQIVKLSDGVLTRL